MKNIYVLFRYKPSPCFITYPTPVRAYESRKAAVAEKKRLEQSARTNGYRYWVNRVQMIEVQEA